ncbi:MAG: glycosyltransferase [Flavobacteriaceae bacterium]|jgi:glycosyltransferase involved in cell wall biosynthesis|nr:glycosyltransferase [Flavobacteriaceae bacterium]
MNKISIIVLTFNQENFIAQTIEGIFMQKIDVPLELIISNDASTDSTAEVIKSAIKNAPENIEVKFFEQPKNLGSTPNFYFALKQITGNYVAFCEGDDFWTNENKLQIQYDFLRQNPEYALCFHQTKNISDDEKIDETLFSKIENRDYSALEIYQHWIVHTSSVFMKTEVLKNEAATEMLKHPDLLYFDTILYMASALNGKIKGLNFTMSKYRRHTAGLSDGINHKRDLRHNRLDEIIGKIYGGKIKESADWQIFSRSRIAFNQSISKGNFILAAKHLNWILKKRKNLKIYIKKKIHHNA